MPEAFDVYIDDNTTSMFKSIGVLSKAEMDARYEVVNESFVKKNPDRVSYNWRDLYKYCYSICGIIS